MSETSKRCLLIVTNKNDVHADAVVRKFAQRSESVFRLNTEDLLEKYSISLEVEGCVPWRGSIQDELGRLIDLSSLRVAWIRRPEFAFNSASTGVEEFIYSEVRALMACIYSIPGIKFVNDYFDSSRAGSKFQQLVFAEQCGIRIPRTIFTNDPTKLDSFIEAARGALLVKGVFTGDVSLDGIPQALPSKRVSKEQLYELRALVKNAPVQIQDYIEKDYELRITVVGEKVFAVRIDSQLNKLTEVDWRPYTNLNPHAKVDLPEFVIEFCRQFVRSQGLLYGALDFIVTPEGEYCFLENNPSGQYLWLEQATSIQITDALVELFVQQM